LAAPAGPAAFARWCFPCRAALSLCASLASGSSRWTRASTWIFRARTGQAPRRQSRRVPPAGCRPLELGSAVVPQTAGRPRMSGGPVRRRIVSRREAA
jgi:hypothetical protein